MVPEQERKKSRVRELRRGGVDDPSRGSVAEQCVVGVVGVELLGLECASRAVDRGAGERGSLVCRCKRVFWDAECGKRYLLVSRSSSRSSSVSEGARLSLMSITDETSSLSATEVSLSLSLSLSSTTGPPLSLTPPGIVQDVVSALSFRRTSALFARARCKRSISAIWASGIRPMLLPAASRSRTVFCSSNCFSRSSSPGARRRVGRLLPPSAVAISWLGCCERDSGIPCCWKASVVLLNSRRRSATAMFENTSVFKATNNRVYPSSCVLLIHEEQE